MVDMNTKCMSIEGNITNVDEILQDKFDLPPFLVEMKQEDIPDQMLLPSSNLSSICLSTQEQIKRKWILSMV